MLQSDTVEEIKVLLFYWPLKTVLFLLKSRNDLQNLMELCRVLKGLSFVRLKVLIVTSHPF